MPPVLSGKLIEADKNRFSLYMWAHPPGPETAFGPAGLYSYTDISQTRKFIQVA